MIFGLLLCPSEIAHGLADIMFAGDTPAADHIASRINSRLRIVPIPAHHLSQTLSVTTVEREHSMSASNTSGIIASANISTKWGWFVALGIAMIVLGVIAWLDVIAATIAGTIFVGAICSWAACSKSSRPS